MQQSVYIITSYLFHLYLTTVPSQSNPNHLFTLNLITFPSLPWVIIFAYLFFNRISSNHQAVFKVIGAIPRARVDDPLPSLLSPQAPPLIPPPPNR